MVQRVLCQRYQQEDPYYWNESTIINILELREYTGRTVNFKTYTNSIWDKKTRENPVEKQAIYVGAPDKSS